MAASPELTGAREAKVGDITVRRLLPLRSRRTVGAWCFVDHYGPMSVDGVAGMRVPPHPHIGLQTVTWLLDGDVLHRDSLGTEQMIRPVSPCSRVHSPERSPRPPRIPRLSAPRSPRAVTPPPGFR
jgi:Pirin